MLVLLVDGLNLIRRIYAAVPGLEGTDKHSDGVLDSSVRSLRRALDDLAPTHGLCVFDAGRRSWRHALHPQYKAGRPPMPASLVELLPRIEVAFEEMSIPPIRVADFEADDVIASIALALVRRSSRVVILSTDKSMLTLLGEGVRVRNHFDNRDLDPSYVRSRFGVNPGQLATYLALVGDRSLGVPGVPSIGAKTATELIAQHGSLDSILAAAEDIPGRLGGVLRSNADVARLSLRLVTLRTDVQVGATLRDFRVQSDRRADDPS